MKPWMLLTILLCAAEICLAQESVPTPMQDQQQESEIQPEDQNQPVEPDAIPIPIRQVDETTSTGDKSFVDGVLQNAINHFGFTMGAYQAYTTNIASDNRPRQSGDITAFIGRAFTNIGENKSKLHFDFGAGYRLYDKHRNLDSFDYYADAQYSYQFSKKGSFQISDQFTSSFNDAWSFISLYSPIHYDFNFSNEVLFNRQRINRNAIRAGLRYQTTRKSRLGIYGGYHIYMYPQNSLRDAHAYEVGASFTYEIAKWLNLSNNYTVYLNHVDEQYRDARIHRLQIGQFNFQLSRSWAAWAGGGVGISEYMGRNRVGTGISAGIGYTALYSSFSLTYQRGFTSAIGLSRLLMSDIISAGFGYRVTRGIRASLSSYYYRSAELDTDGLLETISGGGGLEFALPANLLATVNSFYQNQRTRRFSVQGLGLNRFTAYVGLQYVWPKRRKTD